MTYLEQKGWLSGDFSGSSMNRLHSAVCNNVDYDYQDNASREIIANNVYNHLSEIHNSLKLGELDQAIASLYVTHWNYWDGHADEYELLKDEVAEQRPQKELLENSVKEQREAYENISKEVEKLEKQLETVTDPVVKTKLQNQLIVKQEQESSIFTDLSELEAELQPMLDKEEQLQSLIDEKIYAHNDERLESIGIVMKNTIEALRQATLWSFAYYACDGQIPDDAYQHMLEFANSSEYVHPRKAYEKLCNYGITPVEELKQMLISYEKLEKGLLFLQDESDNKESIGWSKLEAELQRIFGTITHKYYFRGYCRAHASKYGVLGYNYYNNVYYHQL